MAAVSRLGPDDWERARVLWEADATMTHGDLAKMLGTTKQAVQYQAKKHKWTKISNQGDLARRAYDKADAAALNTQKATPAPELPPTGEHPDATANVASVVAATAVELRAKVLERHRKEWDGARNNIYKAIQNSDFDKAKLGKITAEALKIIQDGERKAWGFDKDEDKGQMVVVVKREEN